MTTTHWILAGFIALTIVTFFLMFNLFQKKFVKMEVVLGNHRQNIKLLIIYSAFAMEQDFRKKVELFNNLFSLLSKELQTISLIVNTEVFKLHLQQILADYLIQKVHGMHVVKTIETLTDQLDMVWGTNPDTHSLPMFMADKTDFGFLCTLQNSYGSENNEKAYGVLNSARAKFDPFAKKYLKNHHAIRNNFGYLFDELEAAKYENVQPIVLEWIRRGGKPSGKMYRKLAEALG